MLPSPSFRVWHWAHRVFKRLAPFLKSPGRKVKTTSAIQSPGQLLKKKLARISYSQFRVAQPKSRRKCVCCCASLVVATTGSWLDLGVCKIAQPNYNASHLAKRLCRRPRVQKFNERTVRKSRSQSPRDSSCCSMARGGITKRGCSPRGLPGERGETRSKAGI